MINVKKTFGWLLLILLFITACTHTVPNSGTPGAEITYIVPTPGTDTGVVIGTIMDESTKKPMGGQTIYLGTIVYMTPAPAHSYVLQENSSPHTFADKDGRFALGNVQPGNYIVMVWTPIGTSVIIDPKTGNELSLVVEAGKTVDLGSIEGINPLK
jgi:hypothetical protein